MIEIQSVILSIRKGEESGLKILYHHYADALYGIVLRIVKRQEEAEEVLQAVFLKIWNNIESYNETKATLFTWMAQIARNSAIDRTRLKSFEMGNNTGSFDLSESELKTDSEVSGIDIKVLIKDMPEKYRLLIDKMFLQGYTQQEIADEMDIPLGTVKTRLRDAISKLRDQLKDEKHLLYILFVM
ncbi:MAG: sigma-70 family RNA polymerase sigma factor [Saprospiraceae bacterium]|nr:sigma-70 family RNA polymerase sigma factor [Saprospiraceae bacterium]